MEVSFSQAFLDSLERIDSIVVIDKFRVDEGGEQLRDLHIVCHGKKVQLCVEGVSGECDRLDFYYGKKIGFAITGENIKMNPERTIFEFNFPIEPKATIECPKTTEDTKFLESIGTDLGNSLYKDIPVSSNSLIWKETLGKYIVDRGLQDDHLYNVELLDTTSGILEERPIRFKSYQNIIIEQGNWEIDMVSKSVTTKQEVYSEISNVSFLVWDSPMIDAKVDLSEEPNCIDRRGEYVDPGEIIYGNTNCFQFINYSSSLVGFKITGTEGSNIEVLFNRTSSNGGFTSFGGVIGEDGTIEIRFSDLPYLHFNGIRAVGPSRVTGIETIIYLEENEEEYSPNPDKTYVAKLNNIDCCLMVNGVCDYIEYEKYLGKVKEIGRGREHIDSVPGLIIKPVERGNLSYEVLNLEKQISIQQDYNVGPEVRYAIFQVTIDNNIGVNGNIITTSPLYADYKIRIEQTGVIWKINNFPDYINVDSEGEEHGIFLINQLYSKSTRDIKIITNDSRATEQTILNVVQYPAGSGIFNIVVSRIGSKVIDGERWMSYNVRISASSNNNGDSWRPKNPETDEPYLIRFTFLGSYIPSISFYAIQLKKIDNQIEVWEETIIPGKFTKVENSQITLLNTMIKRFIVVKKGTSGVRALDWYYYDLLGTNQIYITDQELQIINVGQEYLASSGTTILDLGTGILRSTYGRIINVNRSDLIGSIGTLTITESPVYPRSWKNLIDNNTINIGIERELDNIYIKVGRSEEDLRDKDIEISVSSTGTFSIKVVSNFKYIIQTYGNVRFNSSSSTRVEVFSDYNSIKTFDFTLIELDDEVRSEEPYIEIRSGSVVRKITLIIENLRKTHNYFLSGEDSQQNVIRVLENGTVNSPNESFLYRSTTTPKIDASGVVIIKKLNEVYHQEGNYYESNVSISVPNSKSLSCSKYPIKSFGSIREMSRDYSESEKLESTGEVSYLEYPLYMKGKEHYLWCVNMLDDLSNISDPTTPEIRYDIVLNAEENSRETVYVVSRYDTNNRTFITGSPEKTNFKIKRDELEAEVIIGSQENIGLDKKSQIEYAIPIQVISNGKNNRGNIYLGSIEYKAITKITEDSLNDVIEVSDDIVDLENINADYIKNHITSNRTQNLLIRVFQLGLNKDVFDIHSSISDLWIRSTSDYIIPEIGSEYTITGLTVNNLVDLQGENGENIVTISSQWNPKYFLIRVESSERVCDRVWYPISNLPLTSVIRDTNYSLSINVTYRKGDQTGNFERSISYKKYGCNYGLYVEGEAGFGVVDDPEVTTNIQVGSSDNSVSVHAGIFYAVNGINSIKTLEVPAEYKFIGENQPLEYSWSKGDLEGEGNLHITLPPRTQNEGGNKKYILQVTQPHEYYPLNLYITIIQPPLYNPILENRYNLSFRSDRLNIMSDGSVIGDDKLYFTSNLSEFEFSKVEFGWGIKDSSIHLDDLEEVERNYNNGNGYIKFRFKPNGERVFIDAEIYARFTETGQVIGKLDVKQGYYSLITNYYNPLIQNVMNYTPNSNSMSRISSSAYNYIYSYNKGSDIISSYKSYTPCKSNKDNSDTSCCVGRGVYKLSVYKREYYDDREREVDLGEVFEDSKIEFISPENILENYGLDVVLSSDNSDKDAKVNTRFNNSEYATDTIFNEYCPYLELSYLVKEEYIREEKIIIAFGTVILRHPDTGDYTNFYIRFNNVCDASDEPQKVSLLKFSDEMINFDYKGGIKQVSFTPASFGSMFFVDQTFNPDWITVDIPEGSNYLFITANENKSTKKNPSSFRTGQIKIDVKDLRDDYIMESFYINITQEPEVLLRK